MKKLFLLLGCLMIVTACNTMQPVLSVPVTKEYPVQGRQGLLINQRLTFADYETSRVKRCWTRGGNTRVDLLSGQVHNPAFPNLIAMDYNNRDQSYYFQMSDRYGNFSDVYATSAFHSRDLQIGDNPNSMVNILEDIFGRNSYSENLFYLQLFLNQETRPWELVLDNQAAQMFAKEYTGVFALGRDKFYTLKPITQIMGKKGPRNLVMGSVGYEIFNSRDESVAAVSLVDGGNVYFHTRNPDERFLLASLCAALLLQQDVSE